MAKKRNTGIELLRIIAMFGIVLGHFVAHGQGFTKSMDITNKLFVSEQLVAAFTAFKVNIFILITGFFLINRKEINYKKRIGSIWISELFYSILTTIVLIALGLSVSKVEIVKSFLPTITYRYWFVTLYIVLVFVSPMINKVFGEIDKKNYQKWLIILLVLTCIWQTVMPFITTIDNEKGYSIIWFVVVYIVGGYIKRFGEDWKTKKRFLVTIFIIASFAQTAYSIMFTWLDSKYTNIEISIPYYNSIFVLISSIAIFMIFMNVNIKGIIGKIIVFISPSVFGIYLISDNPLIRGILYDKVLHCEKYFNQGIKTITIITIMALIVFISCLLIDFVKRGLFFGFKKVFVKYGKSTN